MILKFLIIKPLDTANKKNFLPIIVLFCIFFVFLSFFVMHTIKKIKLLESKIYQLSQPFLIRIFFLKLRNDNSWVDSKNKNNNLMHICLKFHPFPVWVTTTITIEFIYQLIRLIEQNLPHLSLHIFPKTKQKQITWFFILINYGQNRRS